MKSIRILIDGKEFPLSEELEKLQEKAMLLIEHSTSEEFKEMLFYWHGEEFLAKEMIDSMRNCEDVDLLKAFVNEFKNATKDMVEIFGKPVSSYSKRQKDINKHLVAWYIETCEELTKEIEKNKDVNVEFFK